MNLKEIIKKEIKKLKIKDAPIAVQIPEGLKSLSIFILEELKENQPILFVDPCYGACDLKDKEAKELNCKLLLHIGHKPLPEFKNTKIKVIYVPLDYTLTIEQKEFIIEKIQTINAKKINLVTTAQYLSNISDIIARLQKINITVIDSKKTKRLQQNQILGCDCSSITDLKYPIVFLGDGSFHVNNISFIHSFQDIYSLNPITKTITKIKNNDLFLRQRYAAIARARNCNSFGILVSTKIGQNRIKIAKDIKKKLEKINKKAYIFTSDYINENYLLGIDVECYINTACPRLTYDDFKNFKKPIISVTETEQIIDIKKEIKIDQIN